MVMEDSRLKGYNGTVTHPTLPLERTYCARCGRPWGWATVESSQFIEPANIQVICDPCFDAMNQDAQCPAAGLVVPQSYLELYGLIDENDPRVKDLRESTRRQ